MTDDQTGLMIFKDQADSYYLVPAEALDRGRVPEERKAELKHLLGEQEVSGHLYALISPVGGAAWVAATVFGLTGTPTVDQAKNSWIGQQLGG